MDKKELLTEAQKRHNMNAAAIVEYIETFSDPFSFVETNKFLTYSDSSDEMTDAVITGYATIEGRPVAVAVQNSAVRQGCFSKATIHKMIAITEYAVKREIPLIFGLDSFGTNIKEGAAILAGLSDLISTITYARSIVPVIAAIKGDALGHSALIASLAHVVVASEKSVISYNSPSVVLAGEDKEYKPTEYLGAGNASRNGLTALVVKEEEIGNTIRRLTRYIPLKLYASVPESEGDTSMYNVEVAGAEKMTGTELINALCDTDSFLELYASYSKNIVCGFAYVCGKPVGFLANERTDGKSFLNMESIEEAALFTKLCRNFGLPLIKLVDCDGVEVSLAAERSALWNSAKELLAASAEVRSISIITGKAVGMAYTLLASHSVAETVYAWSTAQITLLNEEAGGIVMYANKLKNTSDIFKAREIAKQTYKEIDGDAYTAATRKVVDDIINPEDTRQYLLSAIIMLTLND